MICARNPNVGEVVAHDVLLMSNTCKTLMLLSVKRQRFEVKRQRFKVKRQRFEHLAKLMFPGCPEVLEGRNRSIPRQNSSFASGKPSYQTRPLMYSRGRCVKLSNTGIPLFYAICFQI